MTSSILEHVRNKGGRPTRLTDDRAEIILDAIADTQTMEVAAALAAVHVDTLYAWIARGRAERQRIDTGITPYYRAQNDIPPAATERRFAEFSEAVDIARACAEQIHVANVKKAALGGYETRVEYGEDGKVSAREFARPEWRASAFWLERARALGWSRRTTLDVNNEHSGKVQVQVTDGTLIAERLRDFKARLAANPQMLSAEADERWAAMHANRVIDIQPERPAVTDGSERDGAGEGEGGDAEG